METPAMPNATDRHGKELPSPPTAADLEQLANRLRVVPEADLPSGVTDRISLEELEQRRQHAIGR